MVQPEYAIVVAGGIGKRMKSSRPKQFLELGGLPMIMHTLNCFFSYSRSVQLTLVLPEEEITLWPELCDTYQFELTVRIVVGGPTRFESVKSGLRTIGDDGLVAVHDGVRPFVSPEIIDASYRSAAKYGSGVVAVSLTDSIRKVDEIKSLSVSRDHYRLVQTPQTFQTGLIKEAYDMAPGTQFTDDASVFEKAGNVVALVEGSYENFKVTNQTDLLRARSFVAFRQSL